MGSNASATTFTETGSRSATFAGFRGKVVQTPEETPVFSTSSSPTLVWTILTYTDSKWNSEQHTHSHQPSALVFMTLILRCSGTSLALTPAEQQLQAVTAWNILPSSTGSPVLTAQASGNKHRHEKLHDQLRQTNGPTKPQPEPPQPHPPTADPLTPTLPPAKPTCSGFASLPWWVLSTSNTLELSVCTKKIHWNQSKPNLHQPRVWPSTTLCTAVSHRLVPNWQQMKHRQLIEAELLRYFPLTQLQLLQVTRAQSLLLC